MTRYPIILAHGLGVTDQGGLYTPWGRVPDLLRARGAVVYLGGQDAWGSRIVYTVIALAALWCISLFFRDTPVTREE